MKKLWQKLGVITFWALWPLWRVYLMADGPRARVLVVHDNKVLLVRSWVGAGLLDLPGGGKHGKETMAEAACRELKEETGIAVTPDQLSPLFESDYREHGLKAHYVCFIVQLSEAPVVKKPLFEITSFTWETPGDIDPQKTSTHVVAAVRAYEARP